MEKKDTITGNDIPESKNSDWMKIGHKLKYRG